MLQMDPLRPSLRCSFCTGHPSVTSAKGKTITGRPDSISHHIGHGGPYMVLQWGPVLDRAFIACCHQWVDAGHPQSVHLCLGRPWRVWLPQCFFWKHPWPLRYHVLSWAEPLCGTSLFPLDMFHFMTDIHLVSNGFSLNSLLFTWILDE